MAFENCGRRELLIFFSLCLLALLSYATTYQGSGASSLLFSSISSSNSISSTNKGKELSSSSDQHHQHSEESFNSNSESTSSSQKKKKGEEEVVDIDSLINSLKNNKKGNTAFSSSSQNTQNTQNNNNNENPRRPFRFHVYKLPRQFVEGAIEQLQTNWQNSVCNRGNKKSDFTMLDWRHAHSLFTADIFITRYMRYHPLHTENPDEADAFIIPMMSHLYNCAGTMHYMVDILSHIVTKYTKNYKELEHRDHYLFWWRWGMHYGSVQKFWRRVNKYFPNINLISFDLLEIMGRNNFQDFSLALKPKFDRNLLNIIMPYPDLSPLLRETTLKFHSSSSSVNKQQQEEEKEARKKDIHDRKRRFLFYFAGTSTIGGIRRFIKWNCDVHLMKVKNKKSSSNGGEKKDLLGFSDFIHTNTNNNADIVSGSEYDCIFVDFARSVTDTQRLGVPMDYPRAMRDSVFCGHAAGDALSSRRPTSAILAGCIPVLTCDLCLYAYEGFIDYNTFAVFIPEADVIAGRMISILKQIYANSTKIRMMRNNLLKVRPHFLYTPRGPKKGMVLHESVNSFVDVEKKGKENTFSSYHSSSSSSTNNENINIENADALDMLALELQRRGLLQRQFRRWFKTNAHLSSDSKDYPLDPAVAMKYVRRDAKTGAVDKSDAGKFPYPQPLNVP